MEKSVEEDFCFGEDLYNNLKSQTWNVAAKI
jgi:hypothetical protein